MIFYSPFWSNRILIEVSLTKRDYEHNLEYSRIQVLYHKEPNMETSVIQCKVCKKDKTRILRGYFVSLNKKWVDENGKLFNGKMCPDCHNEKIRVQTSERRKNDKTST